MEALALLFCVLIGASHADPYCLDALVDCGHIRCINADQRVGCTSSICTCVNTSTCHNSGDCNAHFSVAENSCASIHRHCVDSQCSCSDDGCARKSDCTLYYDHIAQMGHPCSDIHRHCIDSHCRCRDESCVNIDDCTAYFSTSAHNCSQTDRHCVDSLCNCRNNVCAQRDDCDTYFQTKGQYCSHRHRHCVDKKCECH